MKRACHGVGGGCSPPPFVPPSRKTFSWGVLSIFSSRDVSNMTGLSLPPPRSLPSLFHCKLKSAYVSEDPFFIFLSSPSLFFRRNEEGRRKRNSLFFPLLLPAFSPAYLLSDKMFFPPSAFFFFLGPSRCGEVRRYWSEIFFFSELPGSSLFAPSFFTPGSAPFRPEILELVLFVSFFFSSFFPCDF